MSLISTFRNAVKWAGFGLRRTDGATALGVVVVDPDAGSSLSGEQSLTYDAAGNISTITVTNEDGVFVQTLTYSDGKLTGISKWVKQ